MFTDTDSLCYECDEDSYEKMCKYKELFNLSNYPKNSKFFVTIIKK